MGLEIASKTLMDRNVTLAQPVSITEIMGDVWKGLAWEKYEDDGGIDKLGSITNKQITACLLLLLGICFLSFLQLEAGNIVCFFNVKILSLFYISVVLLFNTHFYVHDYIIKVIIF